ncbi:unnamed protein product [Arabidopsis thaliana]|uniref:(thale cress) hypothetical protein n=1 Tax=Arabidopsis thaliana TaxID=3702 RepID=A0A7G2ESJ6_ARATH|nr:unnamed protein product [Arabidopsis thaliana]
MFLWRALSGALAVSTCLQAHGKQGDLISLVQHAIEEAEVWNKLRHRQSQDNLINSQTIRRENRWTKPSLGVLKCNLHVSWLNEGGRCGGAWIVMNAQGDALFHAREMFLSGLNRIAAELKGILWVLQSLHDLHLDNIEVWSDCGAAIEAIIDSLNWPRYSTFLDRIHRLIPKFSLVIFKVSSSKANSIARDIAIAISVTRDVRFRSYLARGGPGRQSRENQESEKEILTLGKTFGCVYEFKQAFLRYSLKTRYDIKLYMSSEKKLGAVCSDTDYDCKWRVYFKRFRLFQGQDHEASKVWSESERHGSSPLNNGLIGYIKLAFGFLCEYVNEGNSSSGEIGDPFPITSEGVWAIS